MDEKDIYRQRRERMVENQIAGRGITDKRVLEAMREVPRHEFVTDHLKEEAYADHPLPIGGGQTISQPYIVALMTEHLRLRGNENVLEIGTGSGYQAAVLSELAGVIHTIELRPELAERAENTFREMGINNVHVHVGDGTLGWEDEAPYDGVIATAAAPKVPDAFFEQLKVGGRIVIPVGARWRQVLEVWTKTDAGMEKEEILPVAFVPLLGENGWQDSDF